MAHQAVRAIIINDNRLLAMRRNKFGLEYYTLIGGGIDTGEQAEAALRREVREEAGMEVGAIRHVFTEVADDPYGVQYVFYCEYKGGDPVLSPDSEEAKISALGQNLYQPIWLPLSELPTTNFLSKSVKEAIIDAIQNGWPAEPEELAWKHTAVAS